MKNGSTKVWLQKDGTKIRLKDMSDQHIINTVAMLERNAKKIYSAEIDACMSMSFNGEQAQMEQERFLSQAEWEDYLPPIYDDLQEEAQRRKLL